MPARLQKAAWYIEDRAPPIEEFEVISRGSLFAAFATVEDFGLTIIGSEYRTLLEGQIKSESTLGWVPFGPVPIHPDFYLAFRKRESDGKPGPLKTFSRGNDVILLIDDPSFTDQELMAALFESLAPVMTDFYAMVLQQSLLGDYQQEISNQFLVLSRAIGQLHETPQWRIPTFRGTVDTARGSLSIIHIRYVNFETELFEYDNSRRDFLGRVRDHSILAKIAGYFERETEPGYQVTQSMIYALRHFEEDLSTSLNLRGILLAALVGVVGVVTGVVLQTALRLFSN